MNIYAKIWDRWNRLESYRIDPANFLLAVLGSLGLFFAGDAFYSNYYAPWHERQELKIQHEVLVRKYDSLPQVSWRVWTPTTAHDICKKKLSEAGYFDRNKQLNELKTDACEEVFEKRNQGVDPKNLEAKLIHGYNGIQF